MLVNLMNGYSCLLFRTLVTFTFLLSPFSKPFRITIATTTTGNHSKAGYYFLMLWYHRRRSHSFLSLLGVEQVVARLSSLKPISPPTARLRIRQVSITTPNQPFIEARTLIPNIRPLTNDSMPDVLQPIAFL
jgi:hypothetical protein